MTSLKTLISKRFYETPDADVCELLQDVMLCDSASTEDWVYDEQDF